jgi:putative FmdB family regulatory protein
MPIFEYRCRDCGAQFEKYQANGAGEIVCAKCRSARVEKLLSVFAVAGSTRSEAAVESGPCPCGAPRRGMCGE